MVERLAVKGYDAANLVSEIIALDDARKKAQTELDAKLAEQNALAKQIGMLMQQEHTKGE